MYSCSAAAAAAAASLSSSFPCWSRRPPAVISLSSSSSPSIVGTATTLVPYSPPTPTSAAVQPLVVANSRTRSDNRQARHQRIRKKVEGTPERPRMSVFRSNKHLYVQVIDDTKMHTLASASTMQKDMSKEFDYSCAPTLEVAKKVGEAIAKACMDKGINKVAFDRGGYPYHGRIEALADSAREHGLEF